jgi:hypothetical protein
VIAADGGVRGVAPKAQILALKALNSGGGGMEARMQFLRGEARGARDN